MPASRSAHARGPSGGCVWTDAAATTVAEATADDAGAFAAFFWEAWQQAGPNAPGFAGATDEIIRELTTQAAIVERLGGPDRRMFLARSGSRVVASRDDPDR